MSKRAENSALEAYPPTYTTVKRYAKRVKSELVDTRRPVRAIFQQGYEEAEKDLALTIDDIERIHTFLYAVKNNKQGMFTFTRLSDEQYEEVLRRFNKAKEEHNDLH